MLYNKHFIKFFILLVLSGQLYCSEILTIYSFRHYKSDIELFEKFTEQTGIQVVVVKSKADTLMERLIHEGSNSPADILITSDASRLNLAKQNDLLIPINSSFLNERIPCNLRDEDGFWFGITKRARVFVYNKSSVDSNDLCDYESLKSDNWKGRILCRSSSSVYNQSLLASIIYYKGIDYALDWAESVRDNMARIPQGNDRDQMRAVAMGLGDLAIVNSYYLGLLINSTNEKDRELALKLGIYFPNQSNRGTHVNVSGAGIVKHTKNLENAVKFLEFLVSDEAQSSFPLETFEYAIVDNVKVSKLHNEWGEFKSDPLKLSLLGDLNIAAIKIFNEAGWE